jgi:Saxitoxin biosynthesis operon protein SxtJ
MSTTPINWYPNRKTLAEFSEFWLFFVGMVASPLALLRGHPTWAAVLWVLAVAVRLLGWLRPAWVKPIFLGLTLATWPIGWVVSHLALAIVYYLVITPIGLAMRIAGRDPLRRAFEPKAITYWEAYKPDQGPDRYLKQF